MIWADPVALEARFAELAAAQPMTLNLLGWLEAPASGFAALVGPGFEVQPYDFPALDGLGFDRYWGVLSEGALLCLARHQGCPQRLSVFAAAPEAAPPAEPWRTLGATPQLVRGLWEHLVEAATPRDERPFGVFTCHPQRGFTLIYRAPTRQDARALAALLAEPFPWLRWQVGLIAEEWDGGSRARWALVRQDDNGNRFQVEALASRVEAELRAAELEAHGHKQTFWVEELR